MAVANPKRSRRSYEMITNSDIAAQNITQAEEQIRAALSRYGLSQTASLHALTGGVSAAIYRVDHGDETYCAKYALKQLKVDKLWFAPSERLFAESAWLQIVGELLPKAVPKVKFEDRDATVLIMEFLDPADHRLWKSELMNGQFDREIARDVGAGLGLIHEKTAGQKAVKDRIDPLSAFHALRTEPYLLRTAELHPECADRLRALAADLDRAEIALVHGDVSPKNILIGPSGPLFLDAECATYGDPAFDVAFCLNHLFLKSRIFPARWPEIRGMIEAFWIAYRARVTWETVAAMHMRVTSLLPALMLARLDGASPVEYLTDEAVREDLRSFAKCHLNAPCASLSAFIFAWGESL